MGRPGGTRLELWSPEVCQEHYDINIGDDNQVGNMILKLKALTLQSAGVEELDLMWPFPLRVTPFLPLIRSQPVGCGL